MVASPARPCPLDTLALEANRSDLIRDLQGGLTASADTRGPWWCRDNDRAHAGALANAGLKADPDRAPDLHDGGHLSRRFSTPIRTSLAKVPTDGCTLLPSVPLRDGILYCLTELPTGLLASILARKVWRRLEIESHFRVLYIFEHDGHILLVVRMCARMTRLGIWRLREILLRVWLRVAVMPVDHADCFLKDGRLQCFGHGNFICFVSCRRPDWLLFDLGKREWTWECPARGLDQDNYNRWFFYEPRLDIRA